MIHRKQLAVIGLVIVLMGLLLSLDIKGLVKDKGQGSGEAATATASAASISIESASESAKQSLNANLAKPIVDLENKLKSASESQKLEIQKQLAQQWDDVNQPTPSALYYEAIGEVENSYANWLKAGDMFSAAYQNTQDTLIQPALTQKAKAAYEKALKLQPSSLDAKTGLGSAVVNGAGSPMEGIQVLLSVVKEDPKNIKANLNLGLFSMKSGQFDKAVGRFKTVVEQNPNPEVYFYLASSYENLGMKSEAIAAYEKCKELAAEPRLTEFVDKKVQELNK
jgi:tetratricopeptide (TPR) repeat protein